MKKETSARNDLHAHVNSSQLSSMWKENSQAFKTSRLSLYLTYKLINLTPLLLFSIVFTALELGFKRSPQK